MNLLVTGAWNCTKEQLNILGDMGHNIFFLQEEKEKLPCNYEWIEGVICNGLFLNHDISRFVNLKYIQTTSAGLDRIPLEYCEKHNIKVNNARGVYSIPIAEYALLGVLDLYKKRKLLFDNQKQHKWYKERELIELFGKTVLIVGCGSVGTECAKRFKAFGCSVLGIDTIDLRSELFDKTYNISALLNVVPEADIIILTLPLTDETRHLVNSKVFQLLKNTAVIINVSRGAIIDTPSLLFALDTKSVGGAVLDVFEDEPLENGSPLWNYDNVIISPHNSFVSNNNDRRLFELIIKNLTKSI